MNKKFIFILLVAMIILGIGVYYFDKTELNNKDTDSLYVIKLNKDINKTIQSIRLTVDNFPLIDGATSTQPIRSLIACKAFNGNCDYWYETEAREMFLSADFYNSSLSYEDQDKIRKKIEKNSKTHDAYLDLILKRNDLILVSTKPSDDEINTAEKFGVKLELTPIGLDGFVFLTHKDNPVTNLNTKDIRDIYTKKETNWKKFNGVDSDIKAFVRQKNSGSQELMQKLVMKESQINPSFEEEKLVFMGMSELIEGVEKDDNSLGYSLYYYKNTMIDKRDLRPDVKLISVDGIEANPENIASRKYPYTFEIYAVTRLDQSKDSPAYQIKEWLTSKEGQVIIKKAGYIGLQD
jgi:phosphate transport system substrate-binding protein